MGSENTLKSEIEATQKAAQYSYYKRKPFIVHTLLSATQAALYAGTTSQDKKAYQDNFDRYGVRGFDDYLVCALNPSEMSITTRLRGAYDRAKGATIYHDWEGVQGKMDVLEVSFTFQSGSLLPHWQADIFNQKNWLKSWETYFSTFKESGGNWQKFSNSIRNGQFVMPFGAEMHQKFMAIVSQPYVLADGTFNTVTVETCGRLFPSLSLMGFFDPESIGETNLSAEDPNQVTWSANFIATGTSPSIASSSEMRGQFRASLVELVQYQNIVGQLVPTYTPEGDSSWLDALLKILSGDLSFSTDQFTNTGAWSAFVPDINASTGNASGKK